MSQAAGSTGSWVMLATYRLPGCKGCCIAKMGSDKRVHFWGTTGTHSVAADDPKRVNAHWKGFCAANRGRKAFPKHLSREILDAAIAKLAGSDNPEL